MRTTIAMIGALVAAILSPGIFASGAEGKSVRQLAAQTPPQLRVVSATAFLRHGIRAPLAEEANGQPLFKATLWGAAPGALTKRGYRNAAILGNWLGQQWRAAGLMPSGCPTADLFVRSNNVPRTIDSARAFLDGAAPGCHLVVSHNPDRQPDPVFDPIGTGALQIPIRELQEVTPTTSARIWANYPRQLQLLRGVYQCPSTTSGCGVETLPDGPINVDAKGVHLDPKTRALAGSAQILLLAYANGLKMPVANGRALDATAVELVSALHAVPFALDARQVGMADLLSRHFIAELQRRIAAPTTSKRVAVYVGHDNVLSALTAKMGIDFTAAGYATNDPPIGGGLVFELVETNTHERRVRVYYTAQTPQQLRDNRTLTKRHQPWKQYYKLLGCPGSASTGCPLDKFVGLMDAKQIT